MAFRHVIHANHRDILWNAQPRRLNHAHGAQGQHIVEAKKRIRRFRQRQQLAHHRKTPLPVVAWGGWYKQVFGAYDLASGGHRRDVALLA